MPQLVQKMGTESLGMPIPAWIPEASRLQVAQLRQQAADKRSREFEDRQMAYCFRECKNCQETSMGNRLDTQEAERFRKNNEKCVRCIGPKGALWGITNNMIPCEVPAELKDLSEIEELLIARIAPLIPCTVLKEGVTPAARGTHLWVFSGL